MTKAMKGLESHINFLKSSISIEKFEKPGTCLFVVWFKVLQLPTIMAIFNSTKQQFQQILLSHSSTGVLNMQLFTI